VSSKKKKPATNKVAPVVEEHPEPEPQDDVPSRQIEEVQDTAPERIEPPAAPEAVETALIIETVSESKPQPIVEVVAEPTPTVEPVAQEAEPEKSAEVLPPPVTEPTPAPVKPKPLTMASLHAEIEDLRRIVDQQAILIKQLMEVPVKQRKPPLSNGKVQIKDTLTGKIYPSKNNVYQSLLKAGELDDLVKQGVFGSDPAKNSFGCYNLFRAYPNRFVEVKPEEIKV